MRLLYSLPAGKSTEPLRGCGPSLTPRTSAWTGECRGQKTPLFTVLLRNSRWSNTVLIVLFATTKCCKEQGQTCVFHFRRTYSVGAAVECLKSDLLLLTNVHRASANPLIPH
ncbi:hypothetical protein AOLI_G00213200 [Acnodon oligacanthus]